MKTNRRVRLIAVALVGAVVPAVWGLTVAKSFDEQCRSADLIGRFKALSVEKIEVAGSTGGPHEVAAVELTEAYKGKKFLEKTVVSAGPEAVLVLQSYSYDDSPDAFEKGEEAVVFLRHLVGPYFTHDGVDAHFTVYGDRVRSQYSDVPTPDSAEDPKTARERVARLPKLEALVGAIRSALGER